MIKDQFWQMGLSERDKEPSHDAGPDRPHDYCWYVIEHINRGEVRRDYQLPLEEAIRLYAGLDSADKRLGVTKDGIDSVDLAVSLNGQERLYDDWRRLDSFARDPVVAGAAELIRQTLEEQTVDVELYDLYGMDPDEDPGPSMNEMSL